MSARADPFKKNQIVGPFRVIRLLDPGQGVTTAMYLAEWTCCKTRVEISHANITRKSGRSVRACKPCDSFARIGKPHVPRAVPVTPAQLVYPMRGVADSNNWIWAHLGAMGFRQAAVDSHAH